MAVTELEYGDAQSRKEYREQRSRYERRKKKKKAKTTAERGVEKLVKRPRELDKLIEELKK